MGEIGCGPRGSGGRPEAGGGSRRGSLALSALGALALFGACRSTPDARTAVEAAEAATRVEDWPRAAELWTEVHVASDGTDRRAYLESARALHESGDPTSACGMLRQGLTVFPDDPELLELHGLVLRQCGFRRAAEDTYARAVELDPQGASALLALAELRLELGLEHAAIEPLERLVALTGGDAHTLSLLGRVQAVEGDPVAAWRSFERAIGLGARDLPTLVQAGHLSTMPRVRSEEPGALEVGERWLEQAVELDPQATRAHFLLGLTQEELGQLVAALESYRRAVETDPGCVEALTNLAVLYARIGDSGGTSEMVARALRIEGDPARRAALMDLLR